MQLERVEATEATPRHILRAAWFAGKTTPDDFRVQNGALVKPMHSAIEDVLPEPGSSRFPRCTRITRYGATWRLVVRSFDMSVDDIRAEGVTRRCCSETERLPWHGSGPGPGPLLCRDFQPD
jgi:hypothetical protein